MSLAYEVMLMKIAHISDTHLGRRPKQTRAGIINQEIRPVEDDFYSAWIKFVDEITDKKNRPDVVVHSGDFFDTPAGYDPNPPPEYARKVAAKTFKQLKDANIPLVIIDGNHGRYMEYRSSTLSEYPIAFDNIYLFTHYDLRDSLKTQKPLFRDLPDLNLRIIAHPSIESKALATLGIQSLYERWVQIQNSAIHPDMINVAVAHGMTTNSTLHPAFLRANYDYVALGDNHKMQKVTDHAWYSGSTEFWNLDEVGDKKGYLIVEIERGKAYPKITPKIIGSSRKAVSEEVEILPADTTSIVVDKVKGILHANGLDARFEYPTAARVRIILKGNKTYGDSFNIGEIESYLRRLALDSDNYNIVEFALVRPEYSERLDTMESQGLANIEYLIENPEEEFKQYITSVRAEDLKKENLNPDLLAKIFADALRGGD